MKKKQKKVKVGKPRLTSGRKKVVKKKTYKQKRAQEMSDDKEAQRRRGGKPSKLERKTYGQTEAPAVKVTRKDIKRVAGRKK